MGLVFEPAKRGKGGSRVELEAQSGGERGLAHWAKAVAGLTME